MNSDIKTALNMLYLRKITDRDQLLNEMLRVKLTQKAVANNIAVAKSAEKLFQAMKDSTENQLGFFPADRDDFFEFFNKLTHLDLLDYAVEIYKNDRQSIGIVPQYLNQFIIKKMFEQKPEKVLIAEAEKFMSSLREIVSASNALSIVLTTESKPFETLLKLIFDNTSHLEIRRESIYQDSFKEESYDYVATMPNFGLKYFKSEKAYFTKDSEGIALEHLLSTLSSKGNLDIIAPAKVAFGTMGYEKLRAFITDNYSVKNLYILPEGTFRPAFSIKTYYLSISKTKQDFVSLGTLKLQNKTLLLDEKKEVSTVDFKSIDSWRVELLLSDNDEDIRKYNVSKVNKVKLKDVAEIFRGKSILKKDTQLGDIAVINISDIEQGEINYAELDTISEEERKIKRYELLDGDLILSCRGTAIKAAVFQAQKNTVIASANLIVIRPSKKVRGEYIKIFLESPTGQAIIKSFQRGTTIMNLNHTDIMELEIPLIQLSKQDDIVHNYNAEWSNYKQVISNAENRWSSVKQNSYQKMIGEDGSNGS